MTVSAVPVLMYHALLPPGVASPHRVHLSVAAFAEQMRWLHEAGYRTVSLPELLDTPARLPARPVVITFDDGYHSLLQYAAPVLRQYGFRPVLFLTTGAVGHPDFSALPALAATTPPTDRPLSWPEVQVLHGLGWAVQAHSHTHASHAGLPRPALWRELLQCRRSLEAHLPEPVRYYAFPYGHYSTQALRALSRVGYAAGFSVHPGLVRPGTDACRLPRLEINSHCTLAEFQRKVTTGYGSRREQCRSLLRDALFRSSRVKDLLRHVLGRRVN